MPVSVQTTSESVILAALRNGDVRRAVELMLDTYQDEVYAYCARLVGRRDAARIYQRVLAAAIGDLQAMQEESPIEGRSLRAWLYSIARRTVSHHHRADQRDFPGSLDPSYVPVAGPAISPGVDDGVRLSDTAMEACLSALDPEIREILQLVYWHGLRLHEVAQVIGEDLSVVRRAVAHGLSAFAVLEQSDGSPS